jgi:hypothetical protein
MESSEYCETLTLRNKGRKRRWGEECSKGTDVSQGRAVTE